MIGNHDREPTEDELRLAREIVVKVFQDRFKNARAATEFERSIIAEADELRDYLVDQDSRTFCILVVSFMEDALRRRFIQSWSIEGKADENAYFGSNGPLSTFAQRLLVAKGAGWLTDEMLQQASILRKLRNEFAHNHRIRSFDAEPLRGLAESLKPFETTWYQESMGTYRAALDAASRETILRIRVYCNATVIVSSALARSMLLAFDLPPDFRGDDHWHGLTEVEQDFIDHMVSFSFKSLGITKSGGADPK